jgi:hypothetical protein
MKQSSLCFSKAKQSDLNTSSFSYVLLRLQISFTRNFSAGTTMRDIGCDAICRVNNERTLRCERRFRNTGEECNIAFCYQSIDKASMFSSKSSKLPLRRKKCRSQTIQEYRLLHESIFQKKQRRECINQTLTRQHLANKTASRSQKCS